MAKFFPRPYSGLEAIEPADRRPALVGNITVHTSSEPLLRYSAREMPLAKDTRGALKCSRAEPGHIAHRRLAPKQTPAYRLADQRVLPARYHIAGLLHFRSGVLHFRLGYL